MSGKGIGAVLVRSVRDSERAGGLTPVARLVSSAVAVLVMILVGILGGGAGCGRDAEPRAGEDARDRIIARNLDVVSRWPSAVLDSLLAAEKGLPTAERVGLWARRFLIEPRAEYRFGLAAGGYAAEGLLVDDWHHDCVSLLYRVSELARARDHTDALMIALVIRFPGAPIDSLADETGRIDYDRPEHLDFSLDMVRSGRWGRDVTASLTGAAPDSAGSVRYAPGSFVYVPTTLLQPGELREGDVIWLVLDPRHRQARRLREEHGLVIGHIGLVIVVEEERRLVHAASSPLSGWYEGGRIEQVPLAVYLAAVDRFAGVVVTRF
jgi:hypothetical protein